MDFIDWLLLQLTLLLILAWERKLLVQAGKLYWGRTEDCSKAGRKITLQQAGKNALGQVEKKNVVASRKVVLVQAEKLHWGRPTGCIDACQKENKRKLFRKKAGATHDRSSLLCHNGCVWEKERGCYPQTFTTLHAWNQGSYPQWPTGGAGVVGHKWRTRTSGNKMIQLAGKEVARQAGKEWNSKPK